MTKRKRNKKRKTRRGGWIDKGLSLSNVVNASRVGLGASMNAATNQNQRGIVFSSSGIKGEISKQANKLQSEFGRAVWTGAFTGKTPNMSGVGKSFNNRINGLGKLYGKIPGMSGLKCQLLVNKDLNRQYIFRFR